MKKDKKNTIFKFIFCVFFISFLVIYFSEITGYYEYQNHQKTALTEEQIKKFENDVKNGEKVDIDKYLIINTKSYNNNLSKLASKLSDSISNIVNKSVKYTFKYISKLIEE